MAIQQSSGFARPAGRWSFERLATVIRAAAGFRMRRRSGRRRAPPLEHLSAHLRRDIGLDRIGPL
jgi:hypothetical protein